MGVRASHLIGARVRLGLTRLRPALPAVFIASLLALVPFPTCVVRLVLGVPCPACGLTRATLAAAHLDWSAALHYNPLSLPLLVVATLTVGAAFVTADGAWRKLVEVVMGAAGVALVVVWALRFAGLFGGPVP